MSTAAETHLEIGAARGRASGRVWLWLALAVACACSYLWTRPASGDAGLRLAGIPLAGAGFEGADLKLDPAAQRILGRAAFLHRRYVFGGREVYVTVIDGSRDRHVVHDPRYCFEGAGWHARAAPPVPVAGGSAQPLGLSRDGQNLQALFWFTDGVSRHASVVRYWWQTVLRRLTLGRSGPEPIIVVVQSVGAEPPDWNTTATQLIQSLQL